MNEFELIAQYFNRPSKRADVVVGVGDDAAVLDVPADRRLVAAVDTIVEGVHFLPGTEPSAIGHRALAVNLSDMAAMGAEPAWFTLSLSLPTSDAHWISKFANGLYDLADRYNVSLVGGDTVRGPLSVSVQILGLVEKDKWLSRSAAKPGDAIFVSGVPGEAAAGLALLQKNTPPSAERDQLVDRFLWPEPRIKLGRSLRTLASAAIDVSDGLLADLAHITEMSRCAAHVDIEALPRSSAMRQLFANEECEAMALSGGDDYELLFTVPPERMLDVEAAIASGIRCTPIGRIVEGIGVQCFKDGEAVVVKRAGFDHFSA